MSATIVNETTYTVWCGECPYSTEPTIYRAVAERLADAHDAEKHPDVERDAFGDKVPRRRRGVERS